MDNKECKIKLTSMTDNCGCSSKLEPGKLSQVLDEFSFSNDPNLLVGLHTKDDASVYLLDQNTALVQTVDFFAPVVDDPFQFGQIAAANALSDVYAMGGNPKLALNLLCIPPSFDKEVVKEILQGGLNKVSEAGAIITGGHTIQDNIPKYGLSVTGFVHPSKVLTNSGSRPGDMLILTKPLGTGILTTANKLELLDNNALEKMIESMKFLNKTAKEIAEEFPIHACTDITGFGLLGHLFEMTFSSNVTAHISTDLIPVLPTALAHAKKNILPTGLYRNQQYLKEHVLFTVNIPSSMVSLLHDPQTSGGLLFSVPEKEAQRFVKQLQSLIPCAQIIGYVTNKQDKYITIK